MWLVIMRSALKMCVFLALFQPANADLNLAADYFSLYIYISLQDKLLISPKIVNFLWPPPRTAPDLEMYFWALPQIEA